jgi:hypothetical protein
MRSVSDELEWSLMSRWRIAIQIFGAEDTEICAGKYSRESDLEFCNVSSCDFLGRSPSSQ